MKKCAVLFSGGKDSCLALHKVLGNEKFDVKYLLSIIPENPDSFMFHKPYLNLIEKQAEMLDIDLVVGCSKGEKEKELVDLKELIDGVKEDIDVVVVGGIASSYQGSRIKKICEDLGLEFYSPLWDYSAEQVWEELLAEGFKVILTKISCEGLDAGMLGKVVDNVLFEELKKLSEKYKFRIDFEGGEAESAVLLMPEFNKEIKIDYQVESQGSYNAILNIK